ncbi:transglycosylase SLT domain-containing protein [Roseibacterium sp. SDUM158017]|uniref:transglycosylase SLT domain-containing protein n=1 Tax=Roseicyclus salinarum TaxID=3036773 RepID=UPI0024156444|nr:transglycosylase SLT domain-containing protein [Roseibacterium sp. SDUM158017]MDG4648087.1 transglycosylase SLT domain-containing protein [Roseibacterium sp. SDUM158017]
MKIQSHAKGAAAAILVALTSASSAAAEEASVFVTSSAMSRPSELVTLATAPEIVTPLREGPRAVVFPAPRPADTAMAPLAPLRSLRPIARDDWAAPVLAWEGHPRDRAWTLAVMAALRGPGAALAQTLPRDIDQWCPGYAAGGTSQRRAFWAGLVSALAWHESTHRATAVGGNGQWFGLVQISPSTARGRGCEATTGDALLDGPANLRCAMRIMGENVPRDQVVSQGMRGVAAEWGPFHSRAKREQMRSWVSSQDFCRQPPLPGLRPLVRPEPVVTRRAFSPL